MFIPVSLNLDIQTQYMDILGDFLDSEHKALQYGQLFDVYQLEKSIHGIVKTIREKREALANDLTGGSVRDFASGLPEHMGSMLRRKLDRLEKLEHECLDKASRNADLSLVLAGEKMAVPEHYNVFPGGDAVEGRLQ